MNSTFSVEGLVPRHRSEATSSTFGASPPDWLASQQAESRQFVASHVLPTAEMEEWRYSPIDSLDPSKFSATTDADLGVDVEVDVDQHVAKWVDILGGVSAIVMLVDGVVVRFENLIGDGISLSGADSSNEAMLPPLESDESGYFDHVNRAVADPVFVRVNDGVILDKPILIVDHVASADRLVGSTLTVEVGDRARATIVQAFESDAVASLSAAFTRVVVGADSLVEHDIVIDTDVAMRHVGHVSSSVAERGSLNLVSAVLGGGYSRVRFDCRLRGAGADGSLSAVYRGDDDRIVDLRTFQQHEAPATTSNLNFAGAVSGRSRAVYAGLIRIHESAPRSEAHQTNRILKLSDEAWAESVPNLEIRHNDVVCSHASAVGPIAEDQRFYLESRGVSPEATERLVVEGFLGSRTHAFSIDGLARYVRGRIAEGLTT